MKAVILAAGEGNRMRPLTYTRPKVMLPVAGKPILEHLLIEAREAGITEFVIVVGYRDEKVRDYFGSGARLGLNIHYVTQRRQLGTADALKMIGGQVDGSFLLINGDVIVNRKDIGAMADKKDITMTVAEVVPTRNVGTVETQNGRVTRIHEKLEKHPSNLANAGLYLFLSDVFAAVEQTPKSPRGEYEITSSLQMMLDQGHHISYQKLGYWFDLTYPWDLLPANVSLMKSMEPQNLGEVEEGAVTRGPVSIGKGSRIRSGAYIVGPVIIGEDCDIGPNCFIRPSTTIGNNCHIGASVEVKNSIIMNGTKVPHLNYVGDSIIGEDCNLGAGTKIANLRLDKKPVKVSGKETGLRKLGAIIGDNVETGINACINVGTIIGNGARIGPGARVSGMIAPGTRVF